MFSLTYSKSSERLKQNLTFSLIAHRFGIQMLFYDFFIILISFIFCVFLVYSKRNYQFAKARLNHLSSEYSAAPSRRVGN